MADIDIKLPDAIQQQLAIPLCVDLRLPKPTLPQIRLPTGGTIQGIADLTKGIPSDCSLNFSLALQLAPIMGSIECIVKVLALITPLIDVVKGLGPPPDGPKLLKAIPEFLKAADAMKRCLLVPTPFAMFPFVKDILALIIAMLRCLVQQLRSIIKTLGELELSIAAATRAGNTQLLSALQCARENQQTALESTMQGVEPVKVLLTLARPFLDIAQVPDITIPPLAPTADLTALTGTLNTLQSVLQTLQAIVDTLP
ncbi:hypothetical protein LMG28614_00722 [Paraburkholderia ultramafica]|uniref:Uncharacterized protein n=1 Tax=Paraburkholderia ultramafica TaxID=1544867 RepID=A0A6S7B204_9BURK|nr:hypothetical protein [Paraburkholderia ultramafica]CAB3778766.1 hypothetical protein LMG28614_00722 [Paraburkholderia ultramafica]